MVIKSMSDYRSIDPRDGYYIAGFVDGEGSFNVSLKQRPDYKTTWKLTASFNVSQKDRTILAWLKKILGCGALRERSDGVVYFEVTNINALHNSILPFFERFNFISAKKKQAFSIFSRIVVKMYKKEHHTRAGFIEIVRLREKLNPDIGRKRKYTLQDVMNT